MRLMPPTRQPRHCRLQQQQQLQPQQQPQLQPQQQVRRHVIALVIQHRPQRLQLQAQQATGGAPHEATLLLCVHKPSRRWPARSLSHQPAQSTGAAWRALQRAHHQQQHQQQQQHVMQPLVVKLSRMHHQTTSLHPLHHTSGLLWRGGERCF
jgi:hypothetical protein